ncbi:hypothetical protein ACIHDR_30015 [Nocardia sp. NPDC052278]|uniref:hypothetical protein n=1 Tax=unclassified Nocardia TaxID=2637762 RepID=UPI0036D05F7E
MAACEVALTRTGAIVETWAGYLVAVLISAAGVVTGYVDAKRTEFVLAGWSAASHCTQRGARPCS